MSPAVHGLFALAGALGEQAVASLGLGVLACALTMLSACTEDAPASAPRASATHHSDGGGAGPDADHAPRDAGDGPGSTPRSPSAASGDAAEPSRADEDRPLRDTFDPEAVYFLGTLDEGAVGLDVFAAFDDDDEVFTGVPDRLLDAMIRPTDGRVVYTTLDGDDARVFEVDARASTPREYPQDPEANDTAIALAPPSSCQGPYLVRMAPESGLLVHGCAGTENGWSTEDGQRVNVPVPYEISHVGYSGHLLLDRLSEGLAEYAISDASGEIHGDPLVFDVPLVDVRARSDGFDLLVNVIDRLLELRHVDFEGNVETLHTYPAPPDRIVVGGGCKIDGMNDAICFAKPWDETVDVVVRLPFGPVPPALLHDERTEPLAKIHGGRLVSGP